MKNFFQEFKEHREQQNITLEDISDVTKINVSFLSALEEGDFDVLPDTYVRLFLRAYAKEIGLDPDEAIEKLEIYQGKVSEDKPNRVPEKEETPKPEFGEKPGSVKINLKTRSNFNWKRTLIIIAIFIVIIWFIRSYVSNGQDETPNQQNTELQSNQQNSLTATDAEIVSDEEVADGEVVEQSTQSVGTVNSNEELVLQFSAVARTWVRVQRDTFPSEEYLFLPQDTKTFRAENQMALRIGNSSAANLVLNGETIEDLGSANTVTDLVINENGVVDQTTTIPASASSTTLVDTTTS